ncbi:MAG: GNAT family N-acetyltransferase [Lactobacillus sp.]|nr:GNAT family N-acetyltransferase [Lactobacillus sp.]
MKLKFIRRANQADLTEIMRIINDCKQMLKNAGSSQWQNGYPDEDIILADINANYGWVLVADGKTAGYLAACPGIEPTYQEIDGEWSNNTDPYVTIHRLAIHSDFRGQHLSSLFLSNMTSVMYETGERNFRIDTGRKNIIMQKLVQGLGFEQKGFIKFPNDIQDPIRLAYELNL